MDKSGIYDRVVSVTVFGGSQPKPGSIAYEQAFSLGNELGTLGCKVITGGYVGTMEAVSKGAYEAGGFVIGITCDEIEKWRPVAPNPYLHQEIRCTTLRERLYKLIDSCDIALALPGGIGTLAEVSVMWTQLDIKAIPLKPLILIGNEWSKVIQSFLNNMAEYITTTQINRIIHASGISETIKTIRKYISDNNL